MSLLDFCLGNGNRLPHRFAYNGCTLVRRILEGEDPIERILEIAHSTEKDWLEFKTLVIPDEERLREEGANEDAYRWHLARAVISLANSWGGAVIIGLPERDQGLQRMASPTRPPFPGQDAIDPAETVLPPVPGQPIDFTKTIGKPISWDEFRRLYIEPALFPAKCEWRVVKQHNKECTTYAISRAQQEILRRQVDIEMAYMHGERLVLVLVEPLPALHPEELIRVERRGPRDAYAAILYYHRENGDVGHVQVHQDPERIRDWLQEHRNKLFRKRFHKLLRRQGFCLNWSDRVCSWVGGHAAILSIWLAMAAMLTVHFLDYRHLKMQQDAAEDRAVRYQRTIRQWAFPKFNDIEKQQARLDAIVSSYESGRQSLTAQLVQAKAEIGAMSAEVPNLKQNLQDLRTESDWKRTVDRSLGEVTVKVENLKDQLGQLPERFFAFRDAEQKFTKFEERLKELDQDLTAAEGQQKAALKDFQDLRQSLAEKVDWATFNQQQADIADVSSTLVNKADQAAVDGMRGQWEASLKTNQEALTSLREQLESLGRLPKDFAALGDRQRQLRQDLDHARFDQWSPPALFPEPTFIPERPAFPAEAE